MKNKKALWIGSILLNIFLLGVISSPFFQKGKPPMEKNQRERLVQKATPESRKKISSLMASLREQKQAHHSIQKKFQEDLMDLLSQDKVTEQQVRTLFASHQQTQAIPQQKIEDQFIEIATLSLADRKILVKILSKPPKRRPPGKKRD